MYIACGICVVQVLPFLYEQDYNTAGCSERRRHLLVGKSTPLSRCDPRPHAVKKLSRLEQSAEQCQQDFLCRSCARRTSIIVPIGELRHLLKRIVGSGGCASRATYQCNALRCEYV